MPNRREQLISALEHALPWVILAILLLYTYAKFFKHPYLGYKTDSQGVIFEIYKNGGTTPLEPGDRIIQIGPDRWDALKADIWKPLYGDLQTGQIVQLVVDRGGQQITVLRESPGPNPGEIQDLVFNEGWLTYFFWLFGTLTLYNLRPKNALWGLMIAFNYLTALWIVAGSGNSYYHLWGAGVLFRASIWLCVPVYLQLHWVFPKSFKKLPAWVAWGGYGMAAWLAVFEFFQIIPKGGYLFGFLLGVGGSLALLIAHGILQAEARRDLRLLVFSGLLALLPAITFGLISAFMSMPVTASGAILGLPLIPLAYFFAAYRRQLGNVEIRVNRILSIVIFLVLLITGLAIISTLIDQFVFPSVPFLTDMSIVFVAALAAIWGLPIFQSWVEHSLLGIPRVTGQLRDVFSTRITASSSLVSLSNLLQAEILPALLVGQFVFLKTDRGLAERLIVKNVSDEQIPDNESIHQFVEISGKYLPPYPAAQTQPYSWVRLAMPLKIEDEMIGLWLFGRRDPDDYYSQTEVQTLRALADQSAIALSNILQTGRLKMLYQADVNRYESERLRLALDLHDSVLNQLALLSMKLPDNSFTMDFQASYDQVTSRLREIVGDLRPPMLNYGLKPAIEELGEILKESSNHQVDVLVKIEESVDGNEYPANIDQHIFRIIQEASQNVLKHAQARNLWIIGRLLPNEISLTLEDNGKGFEMAENINLDSLLVKKHFGLAGMVERAELIDADVKIASTPGRGTRIHITWQDKRI
jgi:signal transduction histidine kinase